MKAKSRFGQVGIGLVLWGAIGAVGPSWGGVFTLEEVARYSGFGDDQLRGLAFLNGRMFVLEGSAADQFRIVEREPADPTIVLDSFPCGIARYGMGLAGDDASGMLYGTWSEWDGDGTSALYRIDPELQTVVEAYQVETGEKWNNIGGLCIAGDTLYASATDGPYSPWTELIYEYDLSTGAMLRRRNIDFLQGSNFSSIEVIDDTVVAMINHASVDTGELHSFDLAGFSYLGPEEHSGFWVQGSAFDGTHLWLAEFTDLSGPDNYDLVKYTIPEPGALALLIAGGVLGFARRR